MNSPIKLMYDKEILKALEAVDDIKNHEQFYRAFELLPNFIPLISRASYLRGTDKKIAEDIFHLYNNITKENLNMGCIRCYSKIAFFFQMSQRYLSNTTIKEDAKEQNIKN